MKTKSIISVFLLVLCSLINGQVTDSLKFLLLRPDDFQPSLFPCWRNCGLEKGRDDNGKEWSWEKVTNNQSLRLSVT